MIEKGHLVQLPTHPHHEIQNWQEEVMQKHTLHTNPFVWKKLPHWSERLRAPMIPFTQQNLQYMQNVKHFNHYRSAIRSCATWGFSLFLSICLLTYCKADSQWTESWGLFTCYLLPCAEHLILLCPYAPVLTHTKKDAASADTDN